MGTKEYYLGLDMGVASVGWAVTDKNYNLLRVKGKDLWGVREFDEAQTAEERRTHRISRRRRQREVVRIGLLKDYFHDEIEKIDPYFYQRLENSKYYLEDKDIEVRNKNGIFNDLDYQDADYFKEYPTIFHLRRELLYDESAHDVRLVFLALLNMFKHRGHFLNAGLSVEGNQEKLETLYKDFCKMAQENLGISFSVDVDMEKLEEILVDRDLSRTQRAEQLKDFLEVTSKDKQKQEFLKAICGLKVPAKRLFSDVLEEEKKIDICFSSFDYDEKIPEILETIGESYYEIIDTMKKIYDASIVGKIMKGHQYLSDARVAEYEKHKKDLRILKDVVKRYLSSEEYNLLFRSEEAGSYAAYVNSSNSAKKFRRNMKGRKREDLYITIKRFLKDLPQDDEQVVYIDTEIKNENFLPKQLTASNGVIPNQLHVREMKKILENAEEYLPFLKTVDESGYTVSERIVKLFTFQIPYYIGPTSEKSKTGWVVRKEKGQVLPWNIEEKIDVKATSEKFITTMVRRCSYINDEKVLPKASLEYESFCVLNEINNIAIDGERIPVSLKQDIFNDLYKKGKKVTKKQLVNYLHTKGVLEEETQLTGIDITLNNSLSTYGKFRAILGDKIELDNNKKMVEQIVFWGTVYGDSKKLWKEKIEETYGDCLTKEQIKRIQGFKFKDWGRLSKEFLELPGCDVSIGEKVSLIRMMWESNYNMMELINSPQYSYKEELESRQKNAIKSLGEIQSEDLDEYYFSAPVKRMVWQTLLIIKEITEILGSEPQKIFVEMTRKPDEKKKRTVSRKDKFIALYKNVKSETRDWKEIIDTADSNGTIRSKKMYLYLTQMGRCMYTGDRIDLNDLFNDNLYDIDHIYPRHYVKDDNLNNNMVLVKKTVNAHKSDTYPLELSIQEKQIATWKMLREKGFITEEKYKRLTGRKGFSDEQKADFIARQLVETSQGTKSIANLLKKVLPSTTLVYSKASNVSEFRQTRDMLKCRSVNEFHHAQDAYLNIVVGNVYHVKFTQNPMNFIKKDYENNPEKNKYNLSRMFDWDVSRNGEVAWIAQKEGGAAGTIATVKKVMAKNTPLMTRRNFVAHGVITNETLYSKKKASVANYVPLKSTDNKMQDVTKYGGFNSVSTAYFFLVEHTEKKKRVRTLETVPIYMAERIEKNPDLLESYCKEVLKLVDADVRIRKIKVQSLIKREGYFLHISGKTGNQLVVRNAVNLCLKYEWIKYVKKIEKFMEVGVLDSEISEDKNKKLYLQLRDKFVNGIYAKRPNSVGEKLNIRESIFNELCVKDQCKVLSEILKLTAIGSNAADLRLIKEAGKSGVALISKKLDNAKEMLLINQSITGVYENCIDLLTV